MKSDGEIRGRSQGDSEIVRPSGRLDAASAQRFLESLRHAAQAGQATVILDLSDVPAISAAGLMCLAETLQDLRAGCFVVRGMQPQVQRMLFLAGLPQVAELQENVVDAATSIATL